MGRLSTAFWSKRRTTKLASEPRRGSSSMISFGDRQWNAMHCDMERKDTTLVATWRRSLSACMPSAILAAFDSLQWQKRRGWPWQPQKDINCSTCHKLWTKCYRLKGLLHRATTIYATPIRASIRRPAFMCAVLSSKALSE